MHQLYYNRQALFVSRKCWVGRSTFVYSLVLPRCHFCGCLPAVILQGPAFLFASSAANDQLMASIKHQASKRQSLPERKQRPQHLTVGCAISVTVVAVFA